jgi:hypothetical protein
VNLKRCHRSLKHPAASAYKLRCGGQWWYRLNVMSWGTTVPFTRSGDLFYSVVEQHLGEG